LCVVASIVELLFLFDRSQQTFHEVPCA
jgi:hypothetical protein